MRKLLFIYILCQCITSNAQVSTHTKPFGNIRLSCLIFPPITPLLAVEFRTIDKATIQLETNFINTHGCNLKYFVADRMNGHYIFIGTAFLNSTFLRKDKNITYLPYAGYGYAHRFGKNNAWIFDSRLGFGATTNADKNIILPVLKTGIGRTF